MAKHSYRNSTITAGNKATITSGGDTNIIGGTVNAKTVVADIGGDLFIASPQAVSTYTESSSSSSSSGFGAKLCSPPFCYGASSFSVSAGQNNVDSNFQSTDAASGLHAGDGGFQVNVGGKTTLTGGQITSTQVAVDAGLNTYAAVGGTTTIDLNNTASYDASGYSLSAGISTNFGDQQSNAAVDKMIDKGMDSKAIMNVLNPTNAATKTTGSMGVGAASGNSASTTVSGITGFVGNQAVLTGDTSTALTPIFDKDKVNADVNGQIAITATFGQLAPKAVGDYADKKLLEAINNTDQAGIDQWKEGGAARVALHVVVGGLSGGTAGALGAGTSQAIIPIIAEQIKATDLPEPLKQILIAVAGTAVGLAVAGPTGAATGFNATLNNFLKHDQADALRKDIEKCNAQGNACNQQAIVEKYKALSDANIAAVQSCILAGDPNCVTAITKDAATVGEVAVFGFGGQTTIFEERAKLVTQERVATGPSSLISDVGAAKQMATVRTQVCGSMSATACDTKILELKGDEQVKALKLFAGALAGLPVLGVLVKAAPTLAVAAQMTVAACRASPVLCANEAGILISDILGAEALGGTTLAVGGTAKAVSKLEQKIADLKNAEATTANTAIKTESKACTTGTACFVAGTLVQTASGLKAIETLRDGEMVLSRHEDTQEIGYRPVVATKATHDQVLLEVVVENGRGETEMLHTTSEHPFWVADLGWHKASLLEAGMTLVDQDGNPITVQSQTALVATATVYNIQVEEHHTYHVGTFGVWVHNANCCDVVAQIPVSPTASGGNGGVNPTLINELTANGVKFTPENVIATARSPSGQVVFLETGSPTAGLRHIVQEHATDFANIGVSEAQIPSVVMRAVTEGNIVGYQGRGTTRPIYEITVNGQPQRIAITTGSNGYIVGANPAGRAP